MSSFKFEIPTFPTTEQPVSLKTSAPSPTPLVPKATKFNPTQGPLGDPNASLYFIGTATTVLEWHGLRLLTDPNFLVAGDTAHLGPGVTAVRKTNPAVQLAELPRIDAVLLSHYHADHFDDTVEAELRRDIPIITTPHAHANLTRKPSPPFSAVHVLEHHEAGVITAPNTDAAVRVVAVPGKHVPPGPAGMLEKANDLLGAVPPTNGWMVELGRWERARGAEGFETRYRIYITGDTLVIPELREVAEKYGGVGGVDLMVVHLGGTTIPSKMAPLMMVTMDGKEGAEMVKMFDPKVTVPIHYDDYDLFLSDLDDFKKAVKEADLDKKNIVYLDRGDMFKFEVQV